MEAIFVKRNLKVKIQGGMDMGERYLVTGVQLGCLVAFQDEGQRQEFVDSIIDGQFVGNTDNTDVEKDAKLVSRLLDMYKLKVDGK